MSMPGSQANPACAPVRVGDQGQEARDGSAQQRIDGVRLRQQHAFDGGDHSRARGGGGRARLLLQRWQHLAGVQQRQMAQALRHHVAALLLALAVRQQQPQHLHHRIHSLRVLVSE